MLRRSRRCEKKKSDAGHPRKILGGIENAMTESANNRPRRTSSGHHTRVKRTSTAVLHEPPAHEMLDLGVSPIKRHSAGRSRRSPARASSARIATSTPEHALSRLPEAHLEVEPQPSCMSFDLGHSPAEVSSHFFDATVESAQKPSASRRRGQCTPPSPELSIRKVRHTYSRGNRASAVQVKLFEDIELPDDVDRNEKENLFELNEEEPVKTKAHKPKAHKPHKDDEALARSLRGGPNQFLNHSHGASLCPPRFWVKRLLPFPRNAASTARFGDVMA
ncbi:hypothetical protein HPB50_022584 [Hyalomma asiaticum]|uniref:Uncharacterized protein n=1 Tax=Hyalomma asiaticum TaxID=266040 RepID=A0ACB7RWL7_HYAAI|nr:hypothetical protein HPB50_022584 [Hyalomma asiaticum]